MAEAIKSHWLPVFQAAEDQTEELLAKATQWAKSWDFSGLTLPGEAEVAEAIRLGRRTTPGPDGLPIHDVARGGQGWGAYDVHAHQSVRGRHALAGLQPKPAEVMAPFRTRSWPELGG